MRRPGKKRPSVREMLERIQLGNAAVSRAIGNLRRDVAAMEERMTAELEALTAQVKANTDVEASAVLLIKGIAEKLAAAGTDPTKLRALQDELKTSSDGLAAAVAANTPAEPTE